jgi:L-asparaginase / beta-aspartyl-peptidase
MKFGVVIHGGAWDIPDEACDAHRLGTYDLIGGGGSLNSQHARCQYNAGVSRACEAAFAILSSGGSALDAAEAAVVLMEDDPTFDAGIGSFVNQSGQVELDAIIATDSFKVAGVCAVQHVRNPIKLARLVMEKTPHTLLAGEGMYHSIYIVGDKRERERECVCVCVCVCVT